MLSFTETIRVALTDVLTNTLMPVLTEVLNIIIAVLGERFTLTMALWHIRNWAVLLKLTAFFESLFDVFSGLTEVKEVVGNNVSDTGLTLVDYIFQMSAFYQAILAISAIAFALTFLAAIFGILRSMGDLSDSNKRPVSQVLADSIKAAFTIVMVPLMCMVIMTLSTNILLVVDQEILQNGDSDISDILFITIAEDALIDKDEYDDYASGHAYENILAVYMNFDPAQINFIAAYTSSIFMSLILAIVCLQSILRIFILVGLYAISPLIAVYTPLDGGEKFRAWRRTFIAYVVSAFGPILMMKVYFITLDAVFGNSSTATTVITLGSNIVTDYIIQTIFILGGAYAMYHARDVFMNLVDPMAAQQLNAASGLVMWGVMMAVDKGMDAASLATGGGATAAKAGAKGAATAAKGAASAAKGAAGAVSSAGQAFTGK